ncbi:GNAT family N-acetyltransferase [Shimia biformata]|uniref:GNAT family N-acetyltransferase n=1 Tax=Shimia biformata TaxID=1294299 RepID=UPI001951CA28|nr:GNAT family N-acetyltransferase [Shimia biformata]
MADLLNEIITIGGTTAMTNPVNYTDLARWMDEGSDRVAWHVAEDNSSALLGFQWIGPHPDLPTDACDIATFAAIGKTGIGVGSALFETTKSAARRLGYKWINANIRADNTGGLTYYQSRGFEDYGRKTDVTLDNGQTVDKVLKRFDL